MTPVDVALYQDREHSYIKHLFLTKYLQAAAYKTLQGHSPIFNFVDAFAGPWKVRDDAQYSDASFDQAINTLEAVRADLGKNGVGGLKIRFCFCERNPGSAARLREYAKTKSNFSIYVFEGSFEDNLDAIAAKIPDGFTFTFIDPTGWDIRNDSVFNFLQERSDEFLLNFMADHINRHAEYPKVMESFGRFLADPDWGDEFAALPSDWSNQDCILELLKRKMRTTKAATFLPDISIMLPRKERVKMRLVLGTHSAKGLEVFRDVQEKVERQEMEIRLNLREGDNPQGSFFLVEDTVAYQQRQKGVGCKANQVRAEAIIVNFLRSRNQAFPGPMFNLAMESVAIRRTQLNKLLMDMRERKVVRFDLPALKRVPQLDTLISLADERDEGHAH